MHAANLSEYLPQACLLPSDKHLFSNENTSTLRCYLVKLQLSEWSSCYLHSRSSVSSWSFITRMLWKIAIKKYAISHHCNVLTPDIYPCTKMLILCMFQSECHEIGLYVSPVVGKLQLYLALCLFLYGLFTLLSGWKQKNISWPILFMKFNSHSI